MSTGLNWFKSSYSGGGGDNCVEVALSPESIHIRDSKDINVRPLAVTPTAWSAFATYAANIPLH